LRSQLAVFLHAEIAVELGFAFVVDDSVCFYSSVPLSTCLCCSNRSYISSKSWRSYNTSPRGSAKGTAQFLFDHGFLPLLCINSHVVYCYLWNAGARNVRIVVTRGLCGCKPIFPQGKALCLEECDNLTRPSLANTICCVKCQVPELGRKAPAVYATGVEGYL
jgi:hypothetical protein